MRVAQVTSGLGHPHIVQVFDFSATPTGEPFLVMEFLEGEDLEHRLRRDRRLPVANVTHIVRQVASALAATHAKAIVHRDLKPGNIFLLEAAGETDFVKVLDFGISKARAATTKLTRTSSVMGTPNYMSPEQAKGRVEEIDERTDQWALACIAWECLAGEGPFVGENVPSILFQIVHEPPAPLVPKVAGLPSQVEAVLLRALAKDKNDRFANVNDFALSLEGAVVGTAAPASVPRTGQLAEAPSGAGPPARTTFTQTAGEMDESLDSVPSRPRWIWALAVGAVAALLFGVFLLFRPGRLAQPVVAGPAPVARRLPVPAPPPPKTEPRAPVVAPTAAVQPTTEPEPEPVAAKAPAGKRKAEKAVKATRRPHAPEEPRGMASEPPSPRPKVERKLIEDF